MTPIKLLDRKDRFKIEATGIFLGENLIVSSHGGTRPHVGAVTLGAPKPSLKDPGVISFTSSVLTRMDHKEEDIFKKVSERLSSG